MYCGKCGAENQPGATFCGACGAPLAAEAPAGTAAGQTQPARQPEASGNTARNKKIGIAAVAAVALVAVVGAVSLFGGRGPEATAERLFDMMLSGHPEKILDLVPQRMVDAAIQESGLTRAEVAEQFGQATYGLNAAMDTLGDGLELTYDTVGSEDVSPEELDSIQAQYEQMDVDVTAAKDVEMEFLIRMPGLGMEETTTYSIPVIKAGSGWYIDVANLNL